MEKYYIVEIPEYVRLKKVVRLLEEGTISNVKIAKELSEIMDKFILRKKEIKSVKKKRESYGAAGIRSTSYSPLSPALAIRLTKLIDLRSYTPYQQRALFNEITKLLSQPFEFEKNIKPNGIIKKSCHTKYKKNIKVYRYEKTKEKIY